MKQFFLLSIIFALLFITCYAQEGNLLLPIIVKGKWGFINNSGEVIIKPQFDSAGRSRDGIAIASKDKRIGYINKEGRFFVIEIPSQLLCTGQNLIKVL